MKKRIPELKPGHPVTIHGSGSFRVPVKCDVDILGVTEEVARDECQCTKHKNARGTHRAINVLNDWLRKNS